MIVFSKIGLNPYRPTGSEGEEGVKGSGDTASRGTNPYHSMDLLPHMCDKEPNGGGLHMGVVLGGRITSHEDGCIGK